MGTRIPEVYENCVVNRDAAIEVLNGKLDWCQGLIFSILYRDDDDNVQVITTVGIKNCEDCGPDGVVDSDEWTNTFYESALDTHGNEFYRIIGDSGLNDISFGKGGDSLYKTKINMNGIQYDVLNSKEDTEIGDPFIVQEI